MSERNLMRELKQASEAVEAWPESTKRLRDLSLRCQAYCAGNHYGLLVGTVLRQEQSGKRIRVKSCVGDWFAVEYIRKDGNRDERHPVGWSGLLKVENWIIEDHSP